MEPLQRYGFRVQALGCWMGDRLLGGALFRSYTVPLTPITVSECLDGPIFLDWEPAWADAFVAGVDDLADSANSAALVMQDCHHPDVHRDVVAGLRRGGRKTTVKPGRADAVLPLRGRTLDQIWKGFNHGTRQRIKKARKNGLTVRRLTQSEDLVRAYGAWLATANRKSFSDVRPWASLEPVVRHCLDHRMGTVLASFLGEELLAAALITHIGDTATYVYGGYVDGAEQYSSTQMLQHEAIGESLALGLGSYNFGYLLGQEQPLARGVDEFKLGFGALPQPHLDTIVWERKPVLYASVERFRRGWIGRNLEVRLRKALIRRGEGDGKVEEPALASMDGTGRR
jgi:Acetyltransferase (GNAT) domain